MDHHLPPFPGFRPAAFQFLRDLAANNEREWFKPRKSIYDDEIVWPMQCLLADVSREATLHDLDLTADPKKAIFRIYRDTRFSKNKAPYKTTAGAVLSKDGTRKSFGGVYVHLEPANCFLAAGFWHPENDRLRGWRAHMASNPEAFLNMKDALAREHLALQSDESLKRMPRGYEDFQDSDIATYLKWKSFTTSKEIPEAALQKSDFTGEVVAFMMAVYPLLEYGWQTAAK